MEKRKNKKIKKGTRGTDGREGEREERERENFLFFSLVLSKIYENRTIVFLQSKRQSRSTHRELCVGTKILEFRQTPQGRDFSYFGLFLP